MLLLLHVELNSNQGDIFVFNIEKIFNVCLNYFLFSIQLIIMIWMFFLLCVLFLFLILIFHRTILCKHQF